MIVRRLLLVVPLLLVVSFAVFGLVVLVPGDAAVTIAGGPDAPPESVAAVREELGLDEPFLTQYVDWLGGVVRLDFGDSLSTGRPIVEELGATAPVTLGLALAVLALVVPISLVVGVAGGLRPGSVLDRVLLLLTSSAIAMPSFWVGLLLVTVLSVQYRALPPYGYVGFTEDPVEWLRHVTMPAIALSLAGIATLSRQVRAGLADTMQSAYIRTAWAKGGDTRQVVVGHALKNSAIPAVTVLGLQVGVIIGGAVIIERIFSIPGMGTYLLDAVGTQDVPVIQAVALLFVVTHVVANLAVDVVYGYLNPKVRSS
jgi:peptide/nickel transport system permease protein